MRIYSWRWRVTRAHPTLYRVATVVVAISTAGATATLVRQAELRAEAWGPGREVPVATHDLPMGTVVADSDYRMEARPTTLVPAGAPSPTDPLVGRVIVSAVFEGEPLTVGRLGPDGVSGLSAMLPPGSVAMLVPGTAHLPRLEVGDAVELFGSDRSLGVGQTGPAPAARGGGVEPAGHSGTVLDVATDGSITVAVDARDASTVASAILDGSVLVALTHH